MANKYKNISTEIYKLIYGGILLIYKIPVNAILFSYFVVPTWAWLLVGRIKN